jgi:hypothetical protein
MYFYFHSEIEKETLSTKKNSLKLKLDKNEVNDIASVKQTKPDFFLSCEEEQPEDYMSSLKMKIGVYWSESNF